MDALTHNLEAYLAKGFHPLCDGIALEGISLINESIKDAVNKPDLESRSKMMIASLMGAVAFQKGLGVVHSLGASDVVVARYASRTGQCSKFSLRNEIQH